MISARQALERLTEGNQRFASGATADCARVSPARRAQLIHHQEPFAIVVGCSDSRVPVEIVFDQGLGDLFVIRVAGNIVAPSQLESVEFAATHFGSRLVVLLGHSLCGAVKASLAEIRQPTEAPSRSLRLIVEGIRPSVEALVATEPGADAEALMRLGVRANIDASLKALRRDPVLAGMVRSEGLRVVGAEYSLETGLVDWI